MINISICLEDIPASAKVPHKNGKTYINLTVDKKKEPDQYGKTHSVSMSQSKEERVAKTPKVYVGSGKEFIFNNEQRPSEQTYTQPGTQATNTDLGF